ncbi:MAG: hypothetical protein SFV51_15715, partial [Bryobacteraceae bacterium]|nr:hypothetical protein [Bryobacteraceae bacterium]
MSRPATIAGVVVLAAVTAGGWALWRAGVVLEQSAAEVRRASAFAFTDQVKTPHGLAGIERVAAAASFRDAAWFQDALWIASSDTLFEYNADDGLKERFHAGAELPASGLVRLGVGVAGGESGQQLFIATQSEGLLVFNGSELRHIRPDKPEHRKLTDLLPLESGQVLLGTEKAGVLAWSGAALSPFHESLNGLSVTALSGTLDDLWIGTLDRGLLRLHAGQLDEFPQAPGRILSLARDGSTVYAGGAAGVAEVRDGVFHRMRVEGSFAAALDARQDRLLVGTLDEGIVGDPHIRKGAVRRFPRSGETLWAVAEDAVYASAGGRSGWQRIPAPDAPLLTDNNIAALAVEPSGKAWIGYFDRGVDVLVPGAAGPDHIEDEHVFCINRIVPTREGAVIATANGLVMAGIDGRPRQVLTRGDGLIASHVTDVIVQPDGLIAATPAGITFLSPAGAESIYAFHGLVNNHVYALGARGAQVMAGTLGGISVVDNRVVSASFTTANSALRHNWISALAAVGEEWFAGTYGAGVFR